MFTLEKIEPIVPKPSYLGAVLQLLGFDEAIATMTLYKLGETVKKMSQSSHQKDIKDKIIIFPAYIQVEDEGQEQVQYHFEALTDLRIEDNTDSFNKGNSHQKYPNINFKYQGEKIVLSYKDERAIILKICNYFYKNNIPFKEYKNDSRVYMGKRQSYKEVQVLKKKYNLEW